MAIFDRLGIKVIAGVGLCGAAMALSPDAAATPLKTGGYSCVQGIAGETAPAAVAGGPVVAPVCVPPAPAGAALSGAAGPAAAAPVPAVLRRARRCLRARVPQRRLALRWVCPSVLP